MSNRLSVVIGLLGLVGLASVSFSDERKQPARIRVGYLCNGTYEIIGHLGEPYGELVSVRGVWETTDNGHGAKGLALRITHKDGVILKPERQVVFPDFFVGSILEEESTPLADGEIYEGGAFESGGYIGVPATVEQMRGIAAPDAFSSGFHSFLYLIERQPIKRPQSSR